MPVTFTLWFDVEKKTITTEAVEDVEKRKLWFDVEKKTITTCPITWCLFTCCGLM